MRGGDATQRGMDTGEGAGSLPQEGTRQAWCGGGGAVNRQRLSQRG
jgi:hypothetical protein